MTSIARMAQIADERAAATKKDKSRKGAGRQQVREGGPQAPAPAGARKKRTAAPPLQSRGEVVHTLAHDPAPAKMSAADKRARQGQDALTKTFLITIPTAIDARLEKTRVKRGYRSRAQVVVALLDEGAEK